MHPEDGKVEARIDTPAPHSNAGWRASTFCEILRWRASHQGNERAFVFLDSHGAVAEELTFSALDFRARRIASELTGKGLGGERALLLFPSGLDFVAALFGCFYAGVAAVPVPYMPGKRGFDRLRSIRDDSDPRVLLTLGSLESETARQGFSEILTDLAQIQVDRFDAEFPNIELSALSPDSLALLQYTSGSTGSPKGVMLSQANLIANSAMIAAVFGHDRTSRGVSWLPLFHDMGLVGHVLQPIYLGGLSVLMSPQSFLQRPVRWLRAISNWRATTTGAPAYAIDLCTKMVRDDQMDGLDLGSLKVLYCGSEMVHAEVLERFGARFSAKGFRRGSLLPCFGLAEATLLVTGTRSESGLKKAPPVAPWSNRARLATSCGEPSPGSSVVVVDPEDRTMLADGIVGEIWVQGPHVGQGYWRGGARSDEIFRANLAGVSGRYLRTGDLGFIKAGELYIIGRIKDTIIINGSKHSAEDIEASATRSHPLLGGLTNAAFGIDFNDQERAVLVQEIGSAQLRSDELARAAAQAFASVTIGHGIRLADLLLVRTGSLPRTSSGKISRSRARQLYLANGFDRIGPNGASSKGIDSCPPDSKAE
jgi:acyl-CoA synthetase (AMP-forming)/AMP-acid ligase II